MSDPASLPPPAAAAAGPLDLGRCFREALDLYRKDFLVLLIAAAITEAVSVVTLGILAGPFIGGWVVMVLRAFRGTGKVDLGDLFRAFPRFLPLVGLFYLYLIAVGLASLLLIIPGLLLATAWTFAFPILVDEERGVFDALGESFRVTTRGGRFLPLLALNVILIAIIVGTLAIPFVGVPLGWIVHPFCNIAWLSAYRQVVVEGGARPASTER